MKGLIWLRSDLRTDDNPALLNAIKECEEIIAIYIFSELQWKLHNESNIKHEFLINNLNISIYKKQHGAALLWGRGAYGLYNCKSFWQK